VHFFDLAFTHLLGISKNHMIIMGRHLVIVSGSIALRDTMTAKAVPGVTEYILLARFVCWQHPPGVCRESVR
jgi:hypothetical protein